MTYSCLLESVWHPPLAFAEAGEKALPPELHLQALWYAGAFGREFRTDDGQQVRIRQFGEWNRGAGPDFFHAAVEIDGELRTGDIELDPDSTAWEAHGHAQNPAFSRVALHVIFRPGSQTAFVRTHEHRQVPQVRISSRQLAEAMNAPSREVAIAKPGRCVFPLRHLPPRAVARLLEEAARHRAQAKAARFLRTADVHGRDAALFQATAETLGYRGNSLPMRLLAQRLPLKDLRGQGAAVEARLFGAAGFLSPRMQESAPADTRDYLRRLWDAWWKERSKYEPAPARALPWKTSGQRPANHPHRRIGTLAALVAVWPGYRRLALARPFALKPLSEFLQALEHEFWSFRHTLTSRRSPRNVALFGRSQAMELAANHLIPLALREDGFRFEEYAALRGGAANEKVKRCGLRLFGSAEAAQPWSRNVCHQQALLQIYQDFCLEDFSECVDCPFPEQLSQWR